jgi:hypothetical protein
MLDRKDKDHFNISGKPFSDLKIVASF